MPALAIRRLLQLVRARGLLLNVFVMTSSTCLSSMLRGVGCAAHQRGSPFTKTTRQNSIRPYGKTYARPLVCGGGLAFLMTSLPLRYTRRKSPYRSHTRFSASSRTDRQERNLVIAYKHRRYRQDTRLRPRADRRRRNSLGNSEKCLARTSLAMGFAKSRA
jgi:hypothetical protein